MDKPGGGISSELPEVRNSIIECNENIDILNLPIIIPNNDADCWYSNNSNVEIIVTSIDNSSEQNNEGSSPVVLLESISIANDGDTIKNSSDGKENLLPSTSVNDEKESSNLTNNIEITVEDEQSTEKRVRKKLRNKYAWKIQERKRKHQSGQEYVNSRNKIVSKKEIVTKKDCMVSCKFGCSNNIGQIERRKIFQEYYKLDQNCKYHFLLKTTMRVIKSRPTKEESRRNYSFKYYFYVNNKQIRVCKTFYLTTLSISQKPIYNVHEKKDKCTGMPKTDGRGLKKEKHCIPTEQKQSVIDHIKSFPTVDSHYCRARTKKQYLESHLSISKMYNLYTEWCENYNIIPVKQSMYRYIFCTQFNYAFHKPKSDRCPTCERSEVAKRENIKLMENELAEYEMHISQKGLMREEKKKDKENGQVPVLCFDLQNVITCPRAEIGPLFYLKKLNIYNLTAYFVPTKKVYCAMWHEYIAGRSGNDIASAFIKILQRVIEDNHFTDLITWSDSCVPQNRNSLISYSILNMMKRYPHLNSITLKYSVPGHSAIQEVDSVHSSIERALMKNEFHSPVGLIRILKCINLKNPYVILQMSQNDFKNYSECSKHLNYKLVPFASVISLQFTQDIFNVCFKTRYGVDDFFVVSIKSRGSQILAPLTTLTPTDKQIIRDKREAFMKMLAFMNLQDREFYRIIFKFTDDEMKIKPKPDARKDIISCPRSSKPGSSGTRRSNRTKQKN